MPLSEVSATQGRSSVGGPSLRSFARRLRLRTAIDAAADRIRFEIDHAMVRCYQPLPWRDVERESAGRVDGVVSRWEAMLPLIREASPRSALDIGCNIGWFSLRLASLGIPTVGVEGYPPYCRTAIYSAKRCKVKNSAVLVMMLDTQNTSLLPTVDCTLFLSVWHHLVQTQGMPAATKILLDIWQRTDQILFFETGESEMGSEFRLPPMIPDAQVWLTEYLTDTCPGASIRHLGFHHAGTGGERVAWRSLFAVVREARRPHL